MHSSPSPSSSRRSPIDPIDVALSLIRDGVIEVRPDGTVWKLRNLNAMPLPEPRRLETKSEKRGYMMVRVNASSKGHLMSAHRLVWRALRGPIPPGLDVNHMDGVKTNNHPSNLELVTRGENHRHAYRTGLRKVTDVPRELSSIAAKMRADGLTFAAIAAALGVSQTTAFRACRTT